MQRFCDFTLSLMIILVFLPFLFLIIIVLRITGEGEIFYIQDRVGLNGKNFGLYKFATMIKDSPNIGTGEITIKNDPRVLPFGKFLRKTKINELPQLFNILKGEMSIVGPRPMVPKTFMNYPEKSRQILNKVRPGLTGIGSIVFRDEEKYLNNVEDPTDFYLNNISPHKCNLEVWYVSRSNFWLYIKIISVTAWVVLFPGSKIVEVLFPDIPSLPSNLS